VASANLGLQGDEAAVGLVAVGLLVATLVGWFLAFRDLARRDDAGTGTKVVWAIVVVALGLVGVVLYFLFRPRGATETERAAEQQRSDEFVAKYSQPAEPSPPDAGGGPS
jgi:Phospholipase_D-nuclease N-terminal